MTSRIRILGIALTVVGMVFVGAGAFAFLKAQEGYGSLQAFSAQQNVNLNYNEDGQLVDRGETAGADAIMALLVDDWKYPVATGDLNPNDPLVNTPTEYMYQMATISYHTLNGTQTVVLDEDVVFEGETFAAGTYEFAVDGRYWTDFNREHPIEGPAREMAWTGTAHALIAELGVGTTTGSALQLAVALAGLFAGVGLTTMLTGTGLVWVSRQPALAPVETVRTAPVISPTGQPAPVIGWPFWRADGYALGGPRSSVDRATAF